MSSSASPEPVEVAQQQVEFLVIHDDGARDKRRAVVP